MEKKLNIAEILKDCPPGIELYSLLTGEVIFEGVQELNGHQRIKCRIKGYSEEMSYEIYGSDGTVSNSGECMLFPSRKMRNWKKFKKPLVVEKLEPIPTYWYKITSDEEKNKVLYEKLKDLLPDTMYMYLPPEDKLQEGKIVYNNYNHIDVINDVDRTFSQILKMTCTELRIKE